MVENIYAGYGKKEVLKGVSLRVNSEEIVAIIGPNGAGKSTILKVIAGFLIPYNGKIIFEDRDITTIQPQIRSLTGLGYLMQGGKIFPNLTVKENLEIALGSNKNGMVLDATLAIFSEIKSWLRIRAGLLSGGQRQQVALAMLLLKRPKLLLLDEPSTGLSPNLVSEIISKIKEIKRIFKTGIILVEQNVGEALKISDRIYIIREGRIIGESETPLELINSEALERLFLGDLSDGHDCK